jgi:hypothetical protein
MKRKHRNAQTEDAGRKVQIRTGMKAGFDWSVLNPANWFSSSGEMTETETTAA